MRSRAHRWLALEQTLSEDRWLFIETVLKPTPQSGIICCKFLCSLCECSVFNAFRGSTSLEGCFSASGLSQNLRDFVSGFCVWLPSPPFRSHAQLVPTPSRLRVTDRLQHFQLTLIVLHSQHTWALAHSAHFYVLSVSQKFTAFFSVSLAVRFKTKTVLA